LIASQRPSVMPHCDEQKTVSSKIKPTSIPFAWYIYTSRSSEY
jgi:hypothetical protein